MKNDFNTPDAQAISFTSSVTNAAAGQMKISLSPDQTANLSLQRYYYDVESITKRVEASKKMFFK